MTKIKLQVPSTGVTQEFEISHAERILRMPNNGGWQLPEDSKYNFDKTNGIGLKQNKRVPEGSKK